MYLEIHQSIKTQSTKKALTEGTWRRSSLDKLAESTPIPDAVAPATSTADIVNNFIPSYTVTAVSIGTRNTPGIEGKEYGRMAACQYPFNILQIVVNVDTNKDGLWRRGSIIDWSVQVANREVLMNIRPIASLKTLRRRGKFVLFSTKLSNSRCNEPSGFIAYGTGDWVAIVTRSWLTKCSSIQGEPVNTYISSCEIDK
jgi:hypothetical protein